jgi:hypothetical protein
MNLINTDLAIEPLATSSGSFIADKDYPVCVLGFQLKNLYDQCRLQLKSSYKFRDYIHFLPGSDATPTFFRGVIFSPKNNFLNLFRQLENFNLSLSDLPIKHYKNLLNEYSLTCNNCYAFLQKGIYPVDSECITKVSKNNFDLTDLYTNAFNTKEVPSFQLYGYFTIFILSNKSVFRHGTDNLPAALKKLSDQNK